jgi:hypothetical protein
MPPIRTIRSHSQRRSFSQAAVELFRRLRAMEDNDEWWQLHSALPDELQWPCIAAPDELLIRPRSARSANRHSSSTPCSPPPRAELAPLANSSQPTPGVLGGWTVWRCGGVAVGLPVCRALGPATTITGPAAAVRALPRPRPELVAMSAAIPHAYWGTRLCSPRLTARLARLWQRRTNVWRKKTNPARRAKRLRGATERIRMEARSMLWRCRGNRTD